MSISLLFSAYFFGGTNEIAEQGMGMVGSGFQLRMELHTYVPGVVGNFHNFHQTAVGRQSAQAQAGAGERIAVFVVEFITVAVTFADLIRAINGTDARESSESTQG